MLFGHHGFDQGFRIGDDETGHAPFRQPPEGLGTRDDIGLIGLLILLIHRMIKSNETGGETPLDLLEKRYARGEIDKAEFEEKKRGLTGRSGT